MVGLRCRRAPWLGRRYGTSRRYGRSTMHARGHAEPLPFGERRAGPHAGHAVRLGELVPQARIAPRLARDRLQRVAGARRIGAGAAALLEAVDLLEAGVELDIAAWAALAPAERAGGERPGLVLAAILDRLEVIGVQRAVVAGIAHLVAVEPVEHFVRVAVGAAAVVALVAADHLAGHVVGEGDRAGAAGGDPDAGELPRGRVIVGADRVVGRVVGIVGDRGCHRSVPPVDRCWW